MIFDYPLPSNFADNFLHFNATFLGRNFFHQFFFKSSDWLILVNDNNCQLLYQVPVSFFCHIVHCYYLSIHFFVCLRFPGEFLGHFRSLAVNTQYPIPITAATEVHADYASNICLKTRMEPFRRSVGGFVAKFVDQGNLESALTSSKFTTTWCCFLFEMAPIIHIQIIDTEEVKF